MSMSSNLSLPLRHSTKILYFFLIYLMRARCLAHIVLLDFSTHFNYCFIPLGYFSSHMDIRLNLDLHRKLMCELSLDL